MKRNTSFNNDEEEDEQWQEFCEMRTRAPGKPSQALYAQSFKGRSLSAKLGHLLDAAMRRLDAVSGGTRASPLRAPSNAESARPLTTSSTIPMVRREDSRSRLAAADASDAGGGDKAKEQANEADHLTSLSAAVPIARGGGVGGGGGGDRPSERARQRMAAANAADTREEISLAMQQDVSSTSPSSQSSLSPRASALHSPTEFKPLLFGVSPTTRQPRLVALGSSPMTDASPVAAARVLRQRVGGRTRLHLAAMHNAIDDAKRMLVAVNYDSDTLDDVDAHGLTAVALAARAGHYEMVKTLCNVGASVVIFDHHRNTALHQLLKNPPDDAIGADSDDSDDDDDDDEEEAEAEAEAADIGGGGDAFFGSRRRRWCAAQRGLYEAVHAMLEATDGKLCIDDANEQLNTPLALACLHSLPHIVAELVAHGSSVNARFGRRLEDTPLAVAVRARRGRRARRVVRTLIQSGADANAADAQQQTPLHWAARKQDQRLIELLLANGACADAVDARGRTPMNLADAAAHASFERYMPSLLSTGVTFVADGNLCVDRAAPLGRGKFGSVFNGTFFGMKVAVKVVAGGARAAEAAKVRSEIGLMARAGRHPRCLSVIGATVVGDDFLIVMEKHELGSLAKYLHADDGSGRQRRLMLDVARHVARTAAEGLAWLHHANRPPILHRDLHSNNILLTRGFNAVIADFGLSDVQLTRSAASPSRRLKPRRIAPPEGGVPTTSKDVYQFGLLLLEMLQPAAVMPFDAEYGGALPCARDVERLQRVVASVATPLSAAENELIFMCLRCCEREAECRPTFLWLATRLRDDSPAAAAAVAAAASKPKTGTTATTTTTSTTTMTSLTLSSDDGYIYTDSLEEMMGDF